jgi:LPXTG-site transpeptidase (sortase) family protein
MPRWLTAFVVLLLILIYILPNPVAAGQATGNAIDSMVLFFRTAGNAASDSLPGPTGSGTGTGYADRYPDGGVASGDGTFLTAPAALAAGPLPVPATADPPADTVEEGTLPSSWPRQLHIPRIGVSTGFVGLGLQPDGTLEVPTDAQTAGWYREAPTPGERGPAVVTAHVDWQHDEGVFHDLGRMRPGDEVTVDRSDGVTVTFGVTRVEQYSKSQFPTEQVYGPTHGAELRLITCGGDLDRATHSYTDNVVVYARMIRVG